MDELIYLWWDATFVRIFGPPPVTEEQLEALRAYRIPDSARENT